MTALAGIWRQSESENAPRTVAAMLAAQQQYGPHDQSIARCGEVAFGRGLYRLLPEDIYDQQPLIGADSAWLMAADVRLDNRDDLLRDLGERRDAALSDANVFLLAWLRWGEAALDRIFGDFAFVRWDARERALLLVRDPSGQRPLHFHLRTGIVAFSSMPQGLHAIPEVPRVLDTEQMAAFVADIPRDGRKTFFEGVHRVDPGELIRIDRAGIKARRRWDLPTREIHYPDEAQYVDAFREQLDRATRVRLRGAGGALGAHLSAGLDSGAVATTAATLLAPQGGGLTAFTSAPRLGFDGTVPHPRIADESPMAAAVAALHPNIDHVVVRSDRRSPLDLLGCDANLFQTPVINACNVVWWRAVQDAAAARGIKVMLTGESGNLTISAGNLASIAEYVRRRRWRAWTREARALIREGLSRRGVLAASFGPWTPRPVWRFVNQVAKRDAGDVSSSLVHPDLRPLILERVAAEARGLHPARDERRLRWQILQQGDAGTSRKAALVRWGIDTRDPTTDRRLAEFCFGLPPELLLKDGVTRRLARLGLADRMPAASLHLPRGYQYADWYERIDRTSLDRVLDEMEAGPSASVLDIRALRARAASWPANDLNSFENIGKYRLALLRALSAGAFVNRMSA